VTRDEWNQVLTTEPATPNQRGAVMREFARLGVTDRTQRLAVIAGLLGLDDLASVHELTMGQAGRLINLLPGIDDPDELLDAAAAAPSQDAPSRAPQLAEVYTLVYTLHAVAAAYLVWNNCSLYLRDQQE